MDFRLSRLRSVTALLLVGALPTHAAGEQFADDFEGTTLLVTDSPPGRWFTFNTATGATLAVDPGATHRGFRGLRLVDADVSVGGANSTSLSSPPVTLLSTASLRFWLRIVGSNGQGSAILAQLLAGSSAACDVMAEFSANRLTLAGDDRFGTYTQAPSAMTFDAGTVALVECAVRGLGTTAGQRLLYVNGALAAQQAGLDLSTRAVTEADVGEPWSEDLRFAGTVDFDDVRVADRLQPTRLWVDAGVSLTYGVCAPIDFGVVDAEDVPAPLPYPLAVNFTLRQSMGYSDPTCNSPLRIALDAGVAQGRFYVRPQSTSPLQIQLSYPDLLGAVYVHAFGSADAGADGGTPDAGTPDSGSLEVDAGADARGQVTPAFPVLTQGATRRGGSQSGAGAPPHLTRCSSACPGSRLGLSGVVQRLTEAERSHTGHS